MVRKSRLQPGLTGGRVNALLLPYGRKIGPDPASINAAMIGGITANNASGMCCGTAQNSYQTVAGMRIILADGTILDTSDELSKKAFSVITCRTSFRYLSPGGISEREHCSGRKDQEKIQTEEYHRLQYQCPD